MTTVTTTYENIGPIIKDISELKMGEFFQFPDDGAVYRLLDKVQDGYLCISLDDLQSFTQAGKVVVEPREVNSIEIKVELL